MSDEATPARPWFGVMAPEGKKSGDKRMFGENSLRMRALPLPLSWQKVALEGHKGGIVTATIAEVWRTDGLIWMAGEYLDTPEADEHYNLVEKFGRYGVSVDADDLDEYAIEMLEDGTTLFTDARACSACAVSIPAFAEAWMMNGSYADFAADFAGGWGAPSQLIPTRDPLPKKEDEGQAECEHRDEDGNCLDREPGNEEVEAAEDPVIHYADGKEYPVDEEQPCDPDEDPDCVAEEDSQPEKEVPFVFYIPETLADHPHTNWSEYVTTFKDYTPEQRKKAHTLPDGSYPIEDCADLKNAIQAIGRAKDPAKAKAHIRSRKSDLGCPDVTLPDTWAVAGDTMAHFLAWCQTWTEEPTIQMADLAPGLTEDGPGWLTHPVDTDRLRDYWVHDPEGLIGWGLPDDFYRCEAALAEYVKPQYLKGYCANRHFDALGYWPGQAPHSGATMTTTASTSGYHYVNGVQVGGAGGGSDDPPRSLVAAGPRQGLPRSWFADPGLDGPTALDVEDGRVFGHLATWGTCHIGFDGICVDVPRSASNYAYFLTGQVDTDDGPVYVGNISMGGGHAKPNLSWRPAVEHYDSTSFVVADVACGEDDYGVWVAGAIREGVSEEDIRELKASGGLSGDWREVRRGSSELELVAALAVNVGGFPVPRLQVAASEGRQVTLVAAGIVADDPIEDLTDAVAARLEAREEQKVAAARIEALRTARAKERLAALEV